MARNFQGISGRAASPVLGLALLSGVAAAGEFGPVIVMPGVPGVPVMMNGRDISWAVVEGDWGLARSGQVSPTVVYRLGPPTLIGPAPGPYFPATGYPPAYGRHEVVPSPNRPLPPRAQSYFRSWGTSSGDVPATLHSPAAPPAVIYAPEIDLRRRPRPHP